MSLVLAFFLYFHADELRIQRLMITSKYDHDAHRRICYGERDMISKKEASATFFLALMSRRGSLATRLFFCCLYLWLLAPCFGTLYTVLADSAILCLRPLFGSCIGYWTSKTLNFSTLSFEKSHRAASKRSLRKQLLSALSYTENRL